MVPVCGGGWVWPAQTVMPGPRVSAAQPPCLGFFPLPGLLGPGVFTVFIYSTDATWGFES